MIRRTTSLLSLGIFAAALPAVAAAQSYSPRVGARHGDIELPRVADGKPAALSQFRGKKVLLIHFASW